MSYFDILKVRRKNSKTPTMKKNPFSDKEKKLAEKGFCIKCGQQNSCEHSFICHKCQEDDTFEDIQTEMKELRNRILNNSMK